RKMKDLLTEVKSIFDVIFLDSPPVLAVVDPIILSSLVDGTILVVRSSKTGRKPFLDAVEELRRARSKVIGVLFNQAPVESDKYFSKYYRSYRYQYHDEVNPTLRSTS
ncbi:MAG: hypothetical protein AB1715_07905, partial [Acidobacteriota bacterium]